jgi:hypothetical protein
MALFDPAAHGPVFEDLLRRAPLNPLDAGEPVAAVQPMLAALSDAAFQPRVVRARDMAAACRAGMWLRFNYLDESHKISQDLATPEGSFWHGILHRREPDPSNAAYWFRRVGDHPIFETLAREARDLGLRMQSERWNPFDFIDQCEKNRGRDSVQELLLRQVQRREWELLFDWCFRSAVGNL